MLLSPAPGCRSSSHLSQASTPHTGLPQLLLGCRHSSHRPPALPLPLPLGNILLTQPGSDTHCQAAQMLSSPCLGSNTHARLPSLNQHCSSPCLGSDTPHWAAMPHFPVQVSFLPHLDSNIRLPLPLPSSPLVPTPLHSTWPLLLPCQVIAPSQPV